MRTFAIATALLSTVGAAGVASADHTMPCVQSSGSTITTYGGYQQPGVVVSAPTYVPPVPVVYGSPVYRPVYRPAYQPVYRPAYRPVYRPAYQPVNVFHRGWHHGRRW